MESILSCRRSGVILVFASSTGCWQAGWVLIEHRGQRRASRSPRFCRVRTAVLAARRAWARAPVLSGTVLSVEDDRLSIGARSVVIESAVSRRRARQLAFIGDDVPAGPYARVNGAWAGGRLPALTGTGDSRRRRVK